MNGGQQPASEELPPNFKPCSLKGRPFTPTFDTSCHNNRGIDVWANHAPRGWQATGKSSTLPRNLGQARAGGQLPPSAAVAQQSEQKQVSQKQEVVKTSSSQQLVTSSSSQQVVTQETSTIQQSSSSSS